MRDLGPCVVPVPGLPMWVGHAVLIRMNGPDDERPHYYPRVVVRPWRLALWRAGNAVARPLVRFWRSLYERTPAARPATDATGHKAGRFLPRGK